MRVNSNLRNLAIATLALAAAAPVMRAQNAGHAHSAGMVVMKDASYLGIGVEDVDADRARGLKLKEERGAYVTSVMPNTPASKAGLKEGDVILEYNGQRVEGKEQLIRMVLATAPGKQAKISLWRAGAPLILTATVASHKVVESGDGDWSFAFSDMPPIPNMPDMSHAFNMPSIDIPRMITVMQNPTLGIEGESLAQQAQFSDFFGVKDGVLVRSVAKNSPAERAGMKAGDVIVRLGDTRVAGWRDLAAALRYARPGGTLAASVIRNKKEIPLSIPVEDGR